MLAYRHHLDVMRKKLSGCKTLLKRSAGSNWSAGAEILRIAALSLVVTGCLHPTTHRKLAYSCRPAWLRCLGATLSLANGGTQDSDHAT